MNYEFVTTCVECGQKFIVVWVMDPLRVGPESIARITCPVCGQRFYQKAGDLSPSAPGQNLLTGRPVRSVEAIYDCPHCGKRSIFVLLVHTDLTWAELSKETVQRAVCNNAGCSQRGLVQELKPARVQLGTLSSAWA